MGIWSSTLVSPNGNHISGIPTSFIGIAEITTVSVRRSVVVFRVNDISSVKNRLSL